MVSDEVLLLPLVSDVPDLPLVDPPLGGEPDGGGGASADVPLALDVLLADVRDTMASSKAARIADGVVELSSMEVLDAAVLDAEDVRDDSSVEALE